MTENPTETNEKQCPLTRGEWLALMAAESQVMHGYINLVVTVTSMFVAMVLAVAIYVATNHEYFKSFSTLIYVVIIVVYFVTVAAVMYISYKVPTWASKEEYENSETIREIISGKLTDSDEIRRSYNKRKYYKRRSQCNMRNLF